MAYNNIFYNNKSKLRKQVKVKNKTETAKEGWFHVVISNFSQNF